MRRIFLAFAAVAVLGLAFPLVTVPAEAQDKVVVKTGSKHHRHMHRGHRKVVVIKRGHRHHHHRGHAKVIVR
jgi:hypothetical protein